MLTPAAPPFNNSISLTRALRRHQNIPQKCQTLVVGYKVSPTKKEIND